MSQELFESIADQVVAVGERGVVVFLSNYNEPTIDPLFEERCLALFARGLPVSLLTNASHFGPDRADRLARAGRFRYIGINLPTLDPARYERMHGTRDLARVLSNIDGLAARELSEETAIVVLGDNDEAHRRDVAAIRERFGPRGWEVKPFRIRSRPASGTFVPEPPPVKELEGCELMGSRPFEHLHVTATAKAVLCCQDYYEKLTVGRPEDPDGGGDPGRRRHGATPTLDVRRRGGAGRLPLPPLRVRARTVTEGIAVRADSVSKVYRLYDSPSTGCASSSSARRATGRSTRSAASPSSSPRASRSA